MEIKQTVAPTNHLTHVLQGLFYNAGTLLVVFVCGHCVLEEDVRSLSCASDHRLVWVEGKVMQMFFHFVMREDGRDVLVRDL